MLHQPHGPRDASPAPGHPQLPTAWDTLMSLALSTHSPSLLLAPPAWVSWPGEKPGSLGNSPPECCAQESGLAHRLVGLGVHRIQLSPHPRARAGSA